jgi:hypothetical protein
LKKSRSKGDHLPRSDGDPIGGGPPPRCVPGVPYTARGNRRGTTAASPARAEQYSPSDHRAGTRPCRGGDLLQACGAWRSSLRRGEHGSVASGHQAGCGAQGTVWVGMCAMLDEKHSEFTLGLTRCTTTAPAAKSACLKKSPIHNFWAYLLVRTSTASTATTGMKQ